MARPVWFVKLLQITFPQRHIVARMTRWPVVGRLVEHWLFEGDALTYVPGARVLTVQQTVDPPGEMVLPHQVVEHFVHKASYHWIMNSCICREAEQCQHYPRNLGCLFLGEAVLGINPKLGRLVSEDEALEHIHRCRAAGLVHLIGRNKLDTVWLGVGPGDRLLTICNCCPCCCLWRMLPEVAPSIGAKVSAMPGVRVTINHRCIGCGECSQGICFVDAIRVHEGRAAISDACRGCGRCAGICPNGAIEVAVNPAAANDLVSHLESLVNVR